MEYLLFLMANVALFVRPGEITPLLEGTQFYMYFIIAATLLSVRSLQNQVTYRTLMQQPINLCILGVVAGVMLSHMSILYLGGLIAGMVAMAKVVLYYLLLVALVNTPQRLRQFLMVTALSATVMIGFSVMDYLSFVETWDGNPALNEALEVDRTRDAQGEPKLMKHVVELYGESVTGNRLYTYRMCGLGIFHDPNDVSLVIVVTAILCAAFLMDQSRGPIRILWVAPLAVLAAGLYCTQSRGGLLAGGVAGMVWLAVRYGGNVAIALGTLGAVALPVVLGRAADIDISSGSGQERIKLWSDGLTAITSPRILFGVGEGMYDQYARLVAHNSYIHAFVELGFFGGTMFFGCVFFPAVAYLRLYWTRVRLRDPELERLKPFLAAVLGCWCMGMCSLSRCYAASTYMIFGLSAAYLNLAGFYQPRPRPLVVFDWLIAQRWILCSAGLLACCFVFVRVFARFG